MPDFDFSTVEVQEIAWPKRGRKATPVPEKLLEALRQTFISDASAKLNMREDEVKAFYALLNKAGGMLNMRIEKHVVDKGDGMVTFHFRGHGKRNKEIE